MGIVSARIVFLAAALFAARGADAYTYGVVPAPALPAPASAALSTTSSVSQAPPSGLLYLAPFVDDRRQRDLWRGATNFERVAVEAEGLSGQAKVWSDWDYASMSFLWHRQLGQALAAAGFTVRQGAAPASSLDATEREARGDGAVALLGGEIRQSDMDKRGSDGLFGTDISGTDYTFTMRVQVVLERLSSGQRVLNKDWSYTQVFHDPTRLGRRDGETFPVYFAEGLSGAADSLAEDQDLRAAMGLPLAQALSPSLSPTQTPISAGLLPYWANPKTGKRMDASWNFDPSDGTPRKDFVLVTPTAKP